MLNSSGQNTCHNALQQKQQHFEQVYGDTHPKCTIIHSPEVYQKSEGILATKRRGEYIDSIYFKILNIEHE